jgi:T4 RnlA family RNA ligase
MTKQRKTTKSIPTNVRLFGQLMKIADNDSTKFFYKDMTSGMGLKVRIFSYHVANYSDWLQKGALSSRGIMFELDENNKPVRILCRPMDKFFNLDETPFTMGLDLSKSLYYMTKEDGSLISSFDDKGYLGFKSKTSLYSDQAGWAMEWMNFHPELKSRVLELAKADYTVNFEYVGPKNRIVLGYTEASLRILNVRHNASGDYVEMDELYADPILRPYMVDVYDASECSDEWVEKVRKMEGIEGYIVVLPEVTFKLKTAWYCALHHTKDSINNNKRLALVMVEDAVDDLRGLFVDDQMATDKIASFEELYHATMASDFDVVSKFIKENRHLDRRSYAIKGQVELPKSKSYLFGIAMGQYQSGFDGEQVVSGLKVAYRKNSELIIPKEYV